VFVQDCYAGADTKYRQSVRVIKRICLAQPFARNMFIQVPRDRAVIKAFVPDFTVLHCPNFHADRMMI